MLHRIPIVVALLAVVACGAGSPPDANDDGDNDPPPVTDNDPPGGDELPSSDCGNGMLDDGEMCDSTQVTCAALAGIWKGGTAVCRSDCSGYDVAACTIGSQLTEMVRPAERDARWTNARCNDGTTFDFELSLSPTRSDKWLIYLEGGGRCDGLTIPCTHRPNGLKSSSKLTADRNSLVFDHGDTLMSRDEAVNPSFYDANIAFAHYCSSDGWSGVKTTPETLHDGTVGWVFTGRYNAQAVIEMLLYAYGMNDATSEVLFSGNSAGGFGAQLNVDQIASRMPRASSSGRLAMLQGAAWSSGTWNDPNYTLYGADQPSWVVNGAIADIYGSEVSVKCEALATTRGVDAAMCATGPLAYDSITLPPPVGYGIRVLVARNRLDQGPMNDYGIPVVDACNAADLEAREAWYDDATASMANIAWMYAPADPQESAEEENLHGLIGDPAVWAFEPPGHPGQSLRELVTRFWLARDPDAPGERVEFEGSVPHETDSPQ